MMTEMETALYYTFSTIAQTLASALGLLAVFLALRINAFNRVIYDNMHELQRRRQSDTSEVPEALMYFWSGDPYKFFKAVDVRDPYENRLVEASKDLLKRRSELLVLPKRVFVASAIVIIFSFIVLMTVPWVHDRTSIAVLLLLLGVAGATRCMIWYVQMILTALREV
jgi:hypothetical protein